MHHFGEVVGASCRDDDVATVARQRERGGTADAGPDPGDDRDSTRVSHGRAAPKSSAMRASNRANSVSSLAFHPARASEAAATDAARNRRYASRPLAVIATTTARPSEPSALRVTKPC